MHINSLSSEHKTSITELCDKPDNKTQQLAHPEGKAAPGSLLPEGPISESQEPREVPKTWPSVLLSHQQRFLYASENSLYGFLLFVTAAGY